MIDRLMADQTEKEYRGVRGWLLLFTLSLLIGPASILIWVPEAKGLAFFEVIFLDIVLPLFLIILIVNHSRLAPKLTIAYLLCIQVVFTLNFLSSYDVLHLASSNTIAGFIGASIGNFIWIGYFILSKRVKQTFVKSLSPFAH